MLLLETLNESTAEPEGPQYYLGVGNHSIGRDEGCSIRLTEDRSISRVHAQIVVQPLSEKGWLADISGTVPCTEAPPPLLPRLFQPRSQPYSSPDQSRYGSSITHQDSERAAPASELLKKSSRQVTSTCQLKFGHHSLFRYAFVCGSWSCHSPAAGRMLR